MRLRYLPVIGPETQRWTWLANSRGPAFWFLSGTQPFKSDHWAFCQVHPAPTAENLFIGWWKLQIDVRL